MNKSNLATMYGFDKTYFYMLKKCNKAKYDFIFSFDSSDYKKSLDKYLEYIETLIFDMQDILEYYDGKRKEYAYLLYSLGLSKTKNASMAYSNDANIAYRVRLEKRDFLSVHCRVIKKFKTILNEFKKNEAIK